MNNKIKVSLIIMSLILICFGTLMIINRFNDVKKSNTVKENITKYVHKRKNELQIDFKNLKETNDDVVGYIELKNTDIKYPVVKSKDNDYYLKHDFNRNYNIAGWVFADYRNKFDGTDKNIIVYGHNMKDGSIFGTMENILTDQWYKNEENLYIPLSTVNENMMFKVFSIYEIEPEDYYIETDFNGSEFFSFVSILKSRSIYDFKVDVKGIKTILTLSTCNDSGDKRIVLHAERVN